MFKKWTLVALPLVLIVTGCFPFSQEEPENTEVDNPNNDQEITIVPPVSSPENYYQTILDNGQYMSGEARGFGTDVVYNRLDLDQLEMGLTRIAKEHFPHDQYSLREGYFINRDELNSWLRRYDEENNPNGLNPPLGDGDNQREQEESNPRTLSHILEQNYMVENSNGEFELGGIVVGISLNSVYNFRTEDDQGRYNFFSTPLDENITQEDGERIAAEVVSRLRDEEREEGVFNDIPIVVGLFREQPRESIISGTYFQTAIAEPGSELGSWDSIDENFYLFPSDRANQDVRDDSDEFGRFQEQIQNFFRTYVGVVGKGFYQNDRLTELTVDIPLRYNGKTEIVALTQYIASLIPDYYDDIKVEVNINSVNGEQESLVVSEPGEDPFIHVMD
ncbi:CamS family sex pheromone protein [Alkalicoccobacillus murimartini]|uniref:Protein involved in sex pheromone biosynthesis n=1 Tax=Alkalicoccobacillus murimartini TaxID=171685 RepID=A0ABT9YKN6_9BACI|nr:CamS family sex pheromone protein [Alkalicoccobacillus murimartini]MDQ0208432.1 protein involved in sex pheromone biosynthesis [Alkalicoccobacillus murimartini]